MNFGSSKWNFIGLDINVNVQKKYGSRFYKFLTVISVSMAGLFFIYKIIENKMDQKI